MPSSDSKDLQRCDVRLLTTGGRPKRVLIYGINYAPEPTGVGRYTGELGAFLARDGIDVEVITAAPHYPGWTLRDGYRNSYSVERTERTRITRCPLLLTSDMRGIWRVLAPLTFSLTSMPVAIWRILRFKPHTVLCVEPTLFAVPIALLLAKIIGARTVLHVQDLEIDAAFAVGHVRGEWWKRCAAKFEVALLRAFDAVVTISGSMRTRLHSKGVPTQRLKVVRNWVDLDKIRPLDSSSNFRKELGLSEETFVALYAGNIGAKQALPVLLDAAARLRNEPNVAFVIAGDGPEKKSLVKRYGHLANVRFIPVQPEDRMCELLNSASVHLLPQDPGTADLVLPSKLGGMLASGKPSIVMADPGTELYEFLDGGAIILPTGSSALVADCILRMCRGEQLTALEDNSDRLATLDAKINLPAFRSIILPL